MVEPVLLVMSLVGSVVAGIFLATGLNLPHTRLGGPADVAAGLFSLWWVALAIYANAAATMDLLAAFELELLTVFMTLRYVQIVSLCIGLWGLMFYVSYVLTGRHQLLVPLAVLFAAYYGIVLFSITVGEPHAVYVSGWMTDIAYRAPIFNRLTIALLLLIPPAIAVATYFGLFFAAPSRGQRVRVAFVTMGTVAWMSGILLRHVGASAEWSMLPPALAIASALAVNWAYHPPEWARRHMGLAAHVDAP